MARSMERIRQHKLVNASIMLALCVVFSPLAALSCNDKTERAPAQSEPAQPSASEHEASVWLNGQEQSRIGVAGLGGRRQSLASLLPTEAGPAAWKFLKVEGVGGAGFEVRDPMARFGERELMFYVVEGVGIGIGAFRVAPSGQGHAIPEHLDKPSTFVPKVLRVEVWTREPPPPPPPPTIREIEVTLATGQKAEAITNKELAALAAAQSPDKLREDHGKGKQDQGATKKGAPAPESVPRARGTNKMLRAGGGAKRWNLADVIALRAPLESVQSVRVHGADGTTLLVPRADLIEAGRQSTLRRNKKGQLVFELPTDKRAGDKKSGRIRDMVGITLVADK